MSHDTSISHFLVVYDVGARLAKVTKYDDYDVALSVYSELERKYLSSDDFDVVLLGADSLDTIKRTHSSYFETTEHGFEKYFRDLLAAR